MTLTERPARCESELVALRPSAGTVEAKWRVKFYFQDSQTSVQTSIPSEDLTPDLLSTPICVLHAQWRTSWFFGLPFLVKSTERIYAVWHPEDSPSAEHRRAQTHSLHTFEEDLRDEMLVSASGSRDITTLLSLAFFLFVALPLTCAFFTHDVGLVDAFRESVSDNGTLLRATNTHTYHDQIRPLLTSWDNFFFETKFINHCHPTGGRAKAMTFGEMCWLKFVDGAYFALLAIAAGIITLIFSIAATLTTSALQYLLGRKWQIPRLQAEGLLAVERAKKRITSLEVG